MMPDGFYALARQQAAIDRSGGEAFRSGPLDLIRLYLQVFLTQRELSVEREREVWLGL